MYIKYVPFFIFLSKGPFQDAECYAADSPLRLFTAPGGFQILGIFHILVDFSILTDAGFKDFFGLFSVFFF